MKAIKRRDLVSELTAIGFVFDGEGRHPMFKCQFTGFRIPVPNGREVSPGTLRDILKLINKAKELRAQAKSNSTQVNK